MANYDNLMMVHDHLEQLQHEDWHIGLTSLNMQSWGVELVKEMAEVALDERGEAMLSCDSREACIGGKAVALLASNERLSAIAAIEDRDTAIKEIEKEAKGLLDLSDSQAASLFYPVALDQDYNMSVYMAVETEEVWADKAAGIVRVLAEHDVVDWNAAFEDEERDRLWDESRMKELPSEVLYSAVWKQDVASLAVCSAGCAGDGICMADTVRRAFNIRDGDSLQDALDGDLSYLEPETVARLEDYLDGVAGQILGETDEEFDSLQVIRDTNDSWSRADSESGNEESPDRAQELLETAEKTIGYN